MEFYEISTTITAVFSAITATLSFLLSKRIRDEMKSDERLIFGPLVPPESISSSQNRLRCVGCLTFNKSKRKAYISKVDAFDEDGSPIEVSWSERIDNDGIPGNPSGILGIIDSNYLYVRRVDDELIMYIQLHVTHSFSKSPEIIAYAPAQNSWMFLLTQSQ